ncbi:MAG: M13 family metallopeptidase [Chitinophagaceae bacterium]|nr:M13 family metallopeptidase [Chitinophagaceae bacterium]HMN32396.1 M13 family metallopeptidase [Chitinophagaceae bacterium]
MNFTKKIFSTALLLSMLYSCNEESGSVSKQFSSLPEGIKFIEPSYIDSSIKPADDFYHFAGGGWLKNNTIPASETRWGSFNLLEDFNKKVLKELLEEASSNQNSQKGSPEQMVGDFYASGMDTAKIQKEGIHAIQQELDNILQVTDYASLINELARETKRGYNPTIGLYIGPDDKNVTQVICNFYQAGIGLPDRDYYLKNDEKYKTIREKYLTHIANMLKLSGEADADVKATTIMRMETELAKANMDRVEMRDPYKVYNKFSLNDFSSKTGQFDWKSFLEKVSIKNQDSVLVSQPLYFTTLSKMLSTESIDNWKVYLKWHLVSSMAPFLSSDFDNENFDFYGKTMRGQQEQKPRWKRVLGVVDGAVGMQLGKMYSDKYFTPKAKERMQELVNNLQVAFEARINNLDWMGDDTKQKAKEKLHSFIKKIGYPDKWKNYDGLTISRNSFIENILASNQFDYEFEVSKLGKPVDKSEWGMTPPTVNAYYNPVFNEIVFPAGILQYPFFDLQTDDASIYGAIGAVIGHEMTHGFDDQGCQYAADGNLKNWWTDKDKKNFDAKTKMVKEQFDHYTILDNKHVNGALTLGENIADLGGITIAYDAFKMTEQGKSTTPIDGFTPDQRFFLSWAQVWRNNIRDEEAAQRLVTDPHSPGIFRCNGPLSNFNPFYSAFNVKEGDKMYKPENERAKVW